MKTKQISSSPSRHRAHRARANTSKQTTSKLHPRHYVKHDYHDHADEPNDPSKTPIRRRKGGVEIPFPVVLHRLVARVQSDGFGHIFGWQPHGRCFVIHKPEDFTDQILPKYFEGGSNKLTSFQRQLNLYGFSRITRGTDAMGYYHEYFLRDREYLAKRIQRTRVKGTKSKGASNPNMEPDFYAIPFVGPFPRPELRTSSASVSSSAASLSSSFNKVEEEEGEEEAQVVSGDYMTVVSSSWKALLPPLYQLSKDPPPRACIFTIPRPLLKPSIPTPYVAMKHTISEITLFNLNETSNNVNKEEDEEEDPADTVLKDLLCGDEKPILHDFDLTMKDEATFHDIGETVETSLHVI
eukprot:scaffold15759_cov174-Amphora_coffeaeformis.AAC.3